MFRLNDEMNQCLNELEQAKNRLRLTTLHAETRSLLWLKEGENVPLKELALVFNLPEGTLKSRLSRAREKVKEFILEKADYEKSKP